MAADRIDEVLDAIDNLVAEGKRPWQEIRDEIVARAETEDRNLEEFLNWFGGSTEK